VVLIISHHRRQRIFNIDAESIAKVLSEPPNEAESILAEELTDLIDLLLSNFAGQDYADLQLERLNLEDIEDREWEQRVLQFAREKCEGNEVPLRLSRYSRALYRRYKEEDLPIYSKTAIICGWAALHSIPSNHRIDAQNCRL
jgi:hypothetical protein